MQSRYYDPIVKRFLNADAFASTGQGFLGFNMFAYCENNPANASDETGELAYPGEIHNAVVNYIANLYGLYKEQIIVYSTGWGRADLISVEGHVWEVKPNKERWIVAGEKQLKKYVENTWGHFPDISLQIGESIESGSFTYQSGYTTYYINYWYARNGVIVYSYDSYTDWGKVSQAAGAGLLVAAFFALTCLTGGAAEGSLQEALQLIP